MELTNVLVGTNMNPLYYKFIPIFIKAWNKLFPNVKVTIVVVAKELVDELLPYKDNIVLFPPIENMNTAFIAQNIRLLYPALMDAEGGILITDMDILPMNRRYYTESISSFDASKFITYRPLSVVGKGEIAMCYNIATKDVWSDIFNINTTKDIVDTLQYIYKNNYYAGTHGGAGWNADQLYLYNKTQEWNKRTNYHIIMDDKYYNRLCRASPNSFSNIELLKGLIKKGNYSDYHAHRPYAQHKTIVNLIVNSLSTS